MPRRPHTAAPVLLFTLLLLALAGTAHADSHAIAMHGEPKYGPGFEHFDYVNPDAPKGGTMRFAVVSASGFDSLNPYILRGVPVAGLGLMYDTLMEQSLDEPFTEYGLVAGRIETPEDRSWARYTLRPEARFHDGEPITPEDVIFTFNLLKEKGHPRYRIYYKDVLRAEQTGPRQVTFHFRGNNNRELPLILGQMPVLPKHYWQEHDFSSTTLEPPLGSGPYRIAAVEPGQRIVYERVDDYWAADLPVKVGRHNFDRIVYEYYRDDTVALQALKAGAYDLRQEYISKNWAVAYDIPAVRNGLLVKAKIPHDLSSGMQGFFYNTRRWVFSDPRVREALAYAFDFQWTNKHLFYGAYERTKSYFSNTAMAARELPDEAELALLDPWRKELPARVFSEIYTPPRTDGEGMPRQNLRTALTMLREAGWEVRDGVLTHVETGRPLRFEILLVNPSFERVVLPFVNNLARLGVQATVRTVDPTTYQNMIDQFDFDMTVAVIPQSLSPGNEQRNFWGCAAAKTTGSFNIAGVCEPAIDALIEKVIAAPDRESLITRVQALDRALLWNFYVIPHWYLGAFRVVYWDKFGRPPENPAYGLAIDTWWVVEEKAARLSGRLQR